MIKLILIACIAFLGIAAWWKRKKNQRWYFNLRLKGNRHFIKEENKNSYRHLNPKDSADCQWIHHLEHSEAYWDICYYKEFEFWFSGNLLKINLNSDQINYINPDKKADVESVYAYLSSADKK